MKYLITWEIHHFCMISVLFIFSRQFQFHGNSISTIIECDCVDDLENVIQRSQEDVLKKIQKDVPNQISGVRHMTDTRATLINIIEVG